MSYEVNTRFGRNFRQVFIYFWSFIILHTNSLTCLIFFLFLLVLARVRFFFSVITRRYIYIGSESTGEQLRELKDYLCLPLGTLEQHSRKFTCYKFFFLFDYLRKRVTNIHIFFRFNSFVERHSGKFILIIIFSFILLTVKEIYTNTPIIKSFFFSLTTWTGEFIIIVIFIVLRKCILTFLFFFL